MSTQNNQLAFVFPGQGSQSVGMLTEMAESFPDVKDTFAQASEVLELDLWALVTDGPAEDLNQTQNTQPAMLAAGVALWKVWCAQSEVRPAYMAGHSLGEYTALVCSGVLSFADAIALVAARGRFMQEAVPDGVGAMAAVLGLTDEQVIQVCTDAAQGDVCSAVNFNSPGQVVIAGNSAAIDRAMVAAKEAGAKRALKLPVSVPSHCALMQPAADKLYTKMQDMHFAQADVTLLHNVDVTEHKDAEGIRQALKQQLFMPVRWVDTVNAIAGAGVTTIAELGPGKVLMGLNKGIVKMVDHFTVNNPDTLTKLLEHYPND
ncbi:[acyl-carrier-protein] S-malonyltransferase [Bathymodiolus platifrons methanotrophic gill symbiont]|uniref:ACP S-malonyltransferase n=1 Tax=Bathymodiolus platifrons methanotrophic gill symbiont TaxID=113268 RepID=UPI000B41F376|nr:ACP S-malonyltransferase [Bathymodiolus platifrons methanotrophic gill symbiont]MCK5869136.1 ACP S-malonyltransferase [Methyloprofundus sp.]TXK97300.1 [acyl-carrier-protein] S-malonyltransferase [Methylococcaceae bacterium CS4]TXK99172.1 [acyl-carrier-protein] S-malonyltransferase [Methylococcaceae bacterium CS5]TXL08621.1 [acyl-carrier-protein] S-malonyltransferase [Methylococcaceae bacterium CS1]TXL08736.1 [acyl-carrier-protein] S-malonyltransferase [Methylococcaceae bacterium CS3]TXL122